MFTRFVKRGNIIAVWTTPSRALVFATAGVNRVETCSLVGPGVQLSPLSGVLFNVLADKPYTSPMRAYYNVTTLVVFWSPVFSEKYVTEFQEWKTYEYDGPYICENDVPARQDLFGNYPLTKERGDEVRGFKDLCYYSFSNKIDPFLQGNSRCQFHKF